MVLQHYKVYAHQAEEDPEEEAGGEEEEEEEELVDPMDTVKAECSEKPSCVAFNEKLQECSDRVNSRSNTAETCSDELMDYVHCVDACMSKTLFTKLK